MPRFKVQIDERFTHEMLIEAASAEEATDIAYNLLRDGIRYNEAMQKSVEYDFEASEDLEDYAVYCD